MQKTNTIKKDKTSNDRYKALLRDEGKKIEIRKTVINKNACHFS